MKRSKFGGVKLLLMLAATLILVAQVSAAPVNTDMSDGSARDQTANHEQYAAHYRYTTQTQESVQLQNAESVNNSARERYAAQIAEQSGENGDNGYQNSEAVNNAARERYAARVAEQDQGDADNQYQNSEALTIRERIRAVNAMLDEGDLTEDEIAELRRLRYELELKLNELMGITDDETNNSGNTNDVSQITAIRERILAIDEMLNEGGLADEETAELRRMKYELEKKLEELMSEDSNNNNSNGAQGQNASTGEKNNRSDMVGSIREMIRSFFGF